MLGSARPPMLTFMLKHFKNDAGMGWPWLPSLRSGMIRAHLSLGDAIDPNVVALRS
jgi:hypothetical protein